MQLGFVFSASAASTHSGTSHAFKQAENRLSITSFDSHFLGRPHFLEDDDTSSDFGDCRKRRKPAKRINHEMLELVDKVTNDIHDFRLYHDEDLPMLNSKTEASAMIRKNIIQGSVDDDCQTDEDQRDDAKRMLRDEVRSAIGKFLQDKKDGVAEANIKNLNLTKRFSRIPFHQPCTE